MQSKQKQIYEQEMLQTYKRNVSNNALHINSDKQLTSIKFVEQINANELVIRLCQKVQLIEPPSNIKILKINNCQLKEISGIGSMKLIELDLSSNSVSDIQELKDLTELKILNLGYNSTPQKQLVDISPLCQLLNLQKLNLFRNYIQNIFPLQNLVNITMLNLANNKISNIDVLKGMIHLQQLYLSQNMITHVYPLRFLKDLRDLDVMGNLIYNFKPIQQLQYFDKFLITWQKELSEEQMKVANRQSSVYEAQIIHEQMHAKLKNIKLLINIVKDNQNKLIGYLQTRQLAMTNQIISVYKKIQEQQNIFCQ
ncbi:Leucine_rich repeats-containing protein [Hexamita inflata]|uniref:Leucine rich repeats-containing protein n=1 Tax=Hexamita inflata TaxID=28002 RepID=A0AA86UA07_9EUKA|nr:Leucine rich repeats-containing protein [Hexamita inflata]